MRVLMLGWEFPPFISGGLGTACHGLTNAMRQFDVQVLFVLPKALDPQEAEKAGTGHAPAATPRRRRPRRLDFRSVPSEVRNPYLAGRPGEDAREPETEDPPRRSVRAGEKLQIVGAGTIGGYDGQLVERIQEYARRCVRLAREESFDVVHAHDWITFPAGEAIARETGRPLIVHVHSTEFDRSGQWINRSVYEIERRGVHAADTVICVSHRTRRIVMEQYGVPGWKIRVVHNGMEQSPHDEAEAPIVRRGRTVLFLGRITMQKGPEYFLALAARLVQRLDNVRFIIAGWGDLGPRMVEQVAAMGLGHCVFFAGFLRGADVSRTFRAADVYVMPSVSEPFGLTALEAISFGVPTIVSKSSGVAEVLRQGALKVDFWDLDRMTQLVTAVLERPRLADALRRHGREEVSRLTWDDPARQCVEIYYHTVRKSVKHRSRNADSLTSSPPEASSPSPSSPQPCSAWS
ncbi:MAG: glycosyltransferase family 4 protein [Planctomycetota bacterium]|nr:glycosyltransferase family 4 protein [Planctomycetota bacterium]